MHQTHNWYLWNEQEIISYCHNPWKVFDYKYYRATKISLEGTILEKTCLTLYRNVYFPAKWLKNYSKTTCKINSLKPQEGKITSLQNNFLILQYCCRKIIFKCNVKNESIKGFTYSKVWSYKDLWRIKHLYLIFSIITKLTNSGSEHNN